MARHGKQVEKLDLAYTRKREDIEEVFADMFGREPEEKNADTKSGAPDLTAPIPPAPEKDAAKITAPGIGAINVDALGSAARLAAKTTALKVGADVSSAPDSTAPVLSAVGSTARNLSALGARRYRIRPIFAVQDGLSLGEQQVYDTMFRLGTPYREDVRELTTGVRSLAEYSRMAYSNCKINLHSLIEKRVIEPKDEGFSYVEGRTYFVYGYRTILRRWKNAGMTHAIRNRGVTFVDPSTGEPISPSEAGVPESRALERVLPAMSDALETSQTSARESGQPSAPESERYPYRVTTNRQDERHSSSGPNTVVQAIRDVMDVVDDDAALRIVTRCRANAPDATEQEIAYFVRQHGPRIRLISHVENPMGVLIVQVPKCFQGESFRQWREAERQRVERERAELLALARKVLEDASADPSERDWARQILTAS